MHGWMEFWGSERARELSREACRGRLIKALKTVRRGERPSLYQRLLMVFRGRHRRLGGQRPHRGGEGIASCCEN